MRFSFVIIVLTCFSLVACKKSQEQPPVPVDKMAEVLLDIQLAETYSLGLGPDSAVSRFSKNYDSLEVFYTAILKHHNLDFAKFNEAIIWYKKRPQQADSLFSLVLDKLHVQQSAFHIPDEELKGADDRGSRLKTDSLNSDKKTIRSSSSDNINSHLDKKHLDSVLKTQLPQPAVLEAPSNE